MLGIKEPSQLAGDCPSPHVSVEGLFWSRAPSSETAATKQKKFQGKISEMPCLPTTSIFLRVKLSIIFQSALLTSAWLLLSPQGPAHAGETWGALMQHRLSPGPQLHSILWHCSELTHTELSKLCTLRGFLLLCTHLFILLQSTCEAWLWNAEVC